MMETYNITGLENVLSNLNQEIDKIKVKSAKGTYEAGLLVERESKKKTPVMFGPLKAGTYTEPLFTSKGPGCEIGYTQEYAPRVHEAPGTLKGLPRAGDLPGHYWESGEPKFLEKALRENERKIINLIKKEIKIKG